MNIVNSVQENFGNADKKYNEMSDGSKISMFVGLISAGMLLLSILLKYIPQLKGVDPVKMIIETVGLDVFIVIISALLAVSGGVNFVTSK